MKRYYKIIDGEKVYAGSSIILDDMRIFNPTDAQLLEAGYEEDSEPEITPYVPTLEDVINSKIEEINEYDVSEEVNSFSINGESGWIDRNTRVALLHALDVVEQSGGTTYTVWFNDNPLTLDITTIKQFLTSLELYAIEALNITNTHIREVKQLQSVQEVENYDITLGYPEKINLNL